MAWLFPPHHLIHNICIALDDLYYLCTYILLHIVRYRYPKVPFQVHGYSCIHCLEQALLVKSPQV